MGRNKKDRFDDLTEMELTLMSALWSFNAETVGVTVAQVHENLKSFGWAYTTIATVLKILERKSFVSTLKSGKVLSYFALVSKAQYESVILNKIVKDVFENSPSMLVARLLKNEKFSSDQIAELQQLLMDRKA